MKNNNKEIIRTLSTRSLKNNRMRNLFAIVAIALTSLLFTSLFSLGSGLIQLGEEQNMRRVGTKAHGGFKAVTQEEYETLIESPLVKDSGYDILIGVAKNEALTKRQTEIRYIQPYNLKFGFTNIIEGRLPEKENEIVLDTIVLDMLQIPNEIGQEVTIWFDFLGQEYYENFVLSGWFEGDQVSMASTAYISEQFLTKVKHGWTDDAIRDFVTDNYNYGDVGLYQANIMFKNARDITGNLMKVVEDSGLELGEKHIAVNWAYMTEQTQDIDVVSVLLLLIIFLVMMLTGFLIIYNIFQISILNDIRFYGLLKTIGTTKKQIKTIVTRQAILLSAIGIPIGLFLGFFVGKVLLPISLNILQGMEASGFEMSANPYIFLFGALFSLITVLLSCRKPSKIASRVSPIEAIKYTDDKSSKQKKLVKIQQKNKKSTNGAKIYKMALSNIARNKKKTAIVIMSMSLSVVLLTEIVTLTKSFNLDTYLEGMLVNDVMICSADLINYNSTINLELSEEYYDFALQQEGVEEVDLFYHNSRTMPHTLTEEGHKKFVNLYEDGKLDVREHNTIEIKNTVENNASISEKRYAYDERLLHKLTVLEGKLDLEKFRTGNYILVEQLMDHDDSYYKPGDRVILNFTGENPEYQEIKDTEGNIVNYELIIEEQKEYEVMALVEIPYSMTERMFSLNGVTTILSKDELLRMDGLAETFAASFLIEDEKEMAFQDALTTYTTKVDPKTDFESKEVLRDEFESMLQAVTMVGGALAFVIAIVGILNFINTMLTSVITRKREFAMLQSLGLTNDQLKKLLLYEGMYYIGFTAIISLIVGSIVSVTAVHSFNNIMLYFDYQFTILPFIATLPVFFIIAFIVPMIAYRYVRNYSLIERLREE